MLHCLFVLEYSRREYVEFPVACFKFLWKKNETIRQDCIKTVIFWWFTNRITNQAQGLQSLPHEYSDTVSQFTYNMHHIEALHVDVWSKNNVKTNSYMLTVV